MTAKKRGHDAAHRLGRRGPRRRSSTSSSSRPRRARRTSSRRCSRTRRSRCRAAPTGRSSLRGRVPNLQDAEQTVAARDAVRAKVLNFLEVAGGQQVMLQVRFAEVSARRDERAGRQPRRSPTAAASSAATSGRSARSASASGTTVDDLGAVESDRGRRDALRPRGARATRRLPYFITGAAAEQPAPRAGRAEPHRHQRAGSQLPGRRRVPDPRPAGRRRRRGAPITDRVPRVRRAAELRARSCWATARIRLKVAPEVSDLDFTTAVRFSGFVDPRPDQAQASTTTDRAGRRPDVRDRRAARTTASRRRKDVTPLLGDLPILGALFRSVRYQRKETELVVLVTPRLVEAMNPDQVPTLPGENWRHPTEARAVPGPATSAATAAERQGGRRTQPADGRRRPAAPSSAASTGSAPRESRVVAARSRRAESQCERPARSRGGRARRDGGREHAE